ncbi:hypothetical protein N9591_01935 [Flavobacteriaceae bacterium]|nr:hypothetical protein [Flavobacteriaceae bacterium]
MGIFDRIFGKKKKTTKSNRVIKKKKSKPRTSTPFEVILKKNKKDLVKLLNFLLEKSESSLDNYKIETRIDYNYVSLNQMDLVGSGNLMKLEGGDRNFVKSKTYKLTITRGRDDYLDIETTLFRDKQYELRNKDIFFTGKIWSGNNFRYHLCNPEKVDKSVDLFDQEKINWIKKNINKKGFNIDIYKKEKVNQLQNSKISLISKIDKDNNGIIDIIEDKNEFNKLLKKHQKVVIEKGKEFSQNYTHQFIKVGNYIKQKRINLQLIFDCIKQVEKQKDLNEFIEILENEIYSYNLLLVNSLNLIVSLIEDDQLTFYEIYEKFDKLNIYNSNWENEITQKLTTLNKSITSLNSNIKDLMFEIRNMGNMIVSSIEDLSYVTENSNKILDIRLGEIDSSIKTNNLLTLISTYQTYKINKNTRSLRS